MSAILICVDHLTPKFGLNPEYLKGSCDVIDLALASTKFKDEKKSKLSVLREKMVLEFTVNNIEEFLKQQEEGEEIDEDEEDSIFEVLETIVCNIIDENLSENKVFFEKRIDICRMKEKGKKFTEKELSNACVEEEDTKESLEKEWKKNQEFLQKQKEKIVFSQGYDFFDRFTKLFNCCDGCNLPEEKYYSNTVNYNPLVEKGIKKYFEILFEKEKFTKEEDICQGIMTHLFRHTFLTRHSCKEKKGDNLYNAQKKKKDEESEEDEEESEEDDEEKDKKEMNKEESEEDEEKDKKEESEDL